MGILDVSYIDVGYKVMWLCRLSYSCCRAGGCVFQSHELVGDESDHCAVYVIELSNH